MGTNIKLTEGQIDRMMKRLVSEQYESGVNQFEKGQNQNLVVTKLNNKKKDKK
jgi:hypothetical protein